MSERERKLSFTAKTWFNPKLGKYLATPVEGPGADDLYGTGATEEAALDALVDGMKANGYVTEES